MADLVENVLAEAAKKEANYKTTEVEKDVELDIDAGNLLAVDTNPIDLKTFRSQNTDTFLLNLARDNTQLLLNEIWKLPAERVDDTITAQLPDPTTILPREKPIPKDKPATKWEQYARLKGIQKHKKGRMTWDEQSKDWKPRWGYKRAGDDTKDWLIEVPDNADPYEDQFAKRMKAKKERTAKNELQRLRNIGRTMKGKVPGVGLTPTEKPEKDDLSLALHAARKSTASMGKFTPELRKEKPAKNVGKKRKYESNFGTSGNEKKRNMDILGKIQNKVDILDHAKAANMAINNQESARAAANVSNPKKRGKGKGKGNATKNSFRNQKKGKKGKKNAPAGKRAATKLKRKPLNK